MAGTSDIGTTGRPHGGAEEPSGPPPGATDRAGRDRTPTRVSASWTAVVIAVLLLILLVIFVAENSQRSTVNFLGAHGHAPTSVSLLIAAVSGAAIVGIVGVARILQLRRKAKRAG